MNILRPVLTLVPILLILNNVNSKSIRHDYFTFPDYTVEAFTPKGLRVSIPHTDGIILFAFHGNINKPMNNIEAGELSMDIVKRTGNRWVYENKHTVLKEDDVLNFWLFVIKNDLGFKLEDQIYKVKKLAPQPMNWNRDRGVTPRPKPSTAQRPTGVSTYISDNKKGCNCRTTTAVTEPTPCSVKPLSTSTPMPTSTTIPTSTPSPTVETTPSQLNQIVSIWTGSLNNVTEEKILLSQKVERLETLNLHFLQVIKNLNSADYKKLIITGKIPKVGDPEDFVRSLLREKLMVKDRFESGERNTDGTITLTMEEYEGKLHVLYVAQEKLKHSQIQVIDPMLQPATSRAMPTEPMFSEPMPKSSEITFMDPQ